ELLYTGATGSLVRDLLQTTDIDAGGDDLINGGDGDKIVLGGFGGDNISAGNGDHDVFGDNGFINYEAGIAVELATTDVDNSTGGDDTITLGTGLNRVFGGVGNDTISTGGGFDQVIGDMGAIVNDATGLLLSIESDLGLPGGDDTVIVGAGSGWIVGGMGGDTVTAGDGSHGILGDNGSFLFDAGLLQIAQSSDVVDATTGDDVITTGNGDDIVIASGGDDTVSTGDGDDIVLGDAGFIDYVGTDGDASTVDTVESGDPWFGGNDTISTGNGSDAIIGGAADDYLDGGAQEDMIIGDGGQITYELGRMKQMQTIDPYTGGGIDYIIGGFGNDIMFGGEGSDTFVANFFEDGVVGDYARYTSASRTMIRFGNDLIGTEQTGLYGSSDAFVKVAGQIGGGYQPIILDGNALSRWLKEGGQDDGRHASNAGATDGVLGGRDPEVDASTVESAIPEPAVPGAASTIEVLPGTNAALDVPAPNFPEPTDEERGTTASDAANAAAALF
ncbi:MAG: calcium-binding protein, partial [Actinomycetota bacterium]|nr:calcium-binding protein [Actinomycetota bacterium]